MKRIKLGVGGGLFISRNDSGCSLCSQHTFIVLETKYPSEVEFKEEVGERFNQFLEDKSSAFSSKFIIYNFEPSAYGSHTGTSKGQSNEEENAAHLNYSHSVSRFLYLIPRPRLTATAQGRR